MVDLDYLEESILSEFECKEDQAWCNKVEEYMMRDFAKELLPFKTEYIYDQPYVNRQLSGLLKYINDFSLDEIESIYILNKMEVNTLYFFFNCHAQSM